MAKNAQKTAKIEKNFKKNLQKFPKSYLGLIQTENGKPIALKLEKIGGNALFGVIPILSTACQVVFYRC